MFGAFAQLGSEDFTNLGSADGYVGPVYVSCLAAQGTNRPDRNRANTALDVAFDNLRIEGSIGCPPPGACCHQDGGCAMTVEGDCQSPGIWQGPGTPCDPNPCLSGACCFPAACEIYDPAECASHGGSYQGNGTLCEPTPCPTSAVATPGETRPVTLEVLPNPGRGETVLRFNLIQASSVTVEIFDLSGARVRSLVSGVRAAGEQTVVWDGRDDAGAGVPSGIYFAKIDPNGKVARARVVLAR